MTWKQVVDTYLVHRVRPLPGRLPGLGDRQGALAEAADHGPARPAVRRGPAGRWPPAPPASRSTPPPLVPNAVTDDVVWDCVTCGACVQECPVSIEHIDHIVDLRRHLVMVEARFPAEAEPMLRDVERSSNPWGKPQSERAAWADGLGVRVLEPGDPAPEVLYWVGCAAVVRRARPRVGRVDREAAAGGRASTSPSSARARPAPATRPGGWATSTRSRRSPSRTSRR